jgi:hypothetical protein
MSHLERVIEDEEIDIEEELEEVESSAEDRIQEDEDESINHIEIDKVVYDDIEMNLHREAKKKGRLFSKRGYLDEIDPDTQNEVMTKFYTAMSVWQDYAEQESDLDFERRVEANMSGGKKRVGSVLFESTQSQNSDEPVVSLKAYSYGSRKGPVKPEEGSKREKIVVEANFNTRDTEYTEVYSKLSSTLDAFRENTVLTEDVEDEIIEEPTELL